MIKIVILLYKEDYDNEYAFVYVLQLNRTTEIISDIFIRTSEEQIPTFNLGLDGFYTLVTLKISKDVDSEYYYRDEILSYL